MKKIFFALNAVILAAGAVWCFGVWNGLPDRIPVHFGFDGQPDRWTGKGGELIVLMLMPFFMSALLYGLTALARKYTGLLNVPDKEKLLALPAEKQEPFWQMLWEFMAALSVTLSLLFFSLVYSVAQVARGAASGLSWIFLAAISLMFLCIIVYIVRLRRALKACIG
ncbi:MAG: DUF1648 domain-containing protein [Spirochaetes bacterium]|nr:DUF1648 domain-containing protein [Spirochaetota bacterium]